MFDPGLSQWVQWPRLQAPRAGIWVRSPVGEQDPTCHRTKTWRSQLEKNNNVTDPQGLSGRSDATNRWMALRIPSGQPSPVQSMMGARWLLLSLLWSISGPPLRMHSWITFPKIIIHQPTSPSPLPHVYWIRVSGGRASAINSIGDADRCFCCESSPTSVSHAWLAGSLTSAEFICS